MEGGNYKALKDEDIQKIHRAVLEVLEKIGLADAIPTCIEACTAAGADYNDKGRLTFSARAGRGHHRQGGAAVRALRPGAAARHGALGQEGLFRHRRRRRAYRRSHDRRVPRSRCLQDLYDIARIVDVMEHIHFFQRAVVPRDMPDPRGDGHQHLLCQRHRAPPSMSAPAGCSRSISKPPSRCCMRSPAARRSGGARPFVSQSNCFVVPPLKFAADACRCLETGGARRHARAAALGGPGRARRRRRRWRARSCRRWRKCWPASLYVNALKPGASGDLRHSGPSSPTCAPAPCRAAARSRRCCRPAAGRWRISTTSPAAPPRA